MLKLKNDAYKVPRREKIFRVLTICALLLALGILMRDLFNRPAANTTDGINCADKDILRNAIQAGGDVYLDCGGVWTLTETLIIQHDTQIYGAGETLTTISGGGTLDVLFRVEAGATLSLAGIRLSGSRDYGIFIKPGSSLLVNNSRFTEHSGVVIWNAGVLMHLTGSTFEDNESAGPLLANMPGSAASIMNSVFRNNRDKRGLVFWSIISNQGAATVDNSIFERNIARYSPVSVFDNEAGSLTVQNSIFRYNEIHQHDMSLIANNATAEMRIEQSQFIANQTQNGAILGNFGTLTLVDTTLTGNPGQPCKNQGTLNDPNHACNL